VKSLFDKKKHIFLCLFKISYYICDGYSYRKTNIMMNLSENTKNRYSTRSPSLRGRSTKQSGKLLIYSGLLPASFLAVAMTETQFMPESSISIFGSQNMEVGTILVEREREREREYTLNIPFLKTRTHARNINIFFQINQRNCLIFLGRFFLFLPPPCPSQGGVAWVKRKFHYFQDASRQLCCTRHCEAGG
jgi:hypothetical protein